MKFQMQFSLSEGRARKPLLTTATALLVSADPTAGDEELSEARSNPHNYFSEQKHISKSICKQL